MKKLFKDAVLSLYDLLFPKVCPGCKQEIIPRNKHICLLCHLSLPQTHFNPGVNLLFEKFPENLKLKGIYSLCAFYPKGMAERLLYAIKYEQQPELGVFLGQLMGQELSMYFNDIKGVIPVPLHPKRERKRGYNQAEKIAEGMRIALNCLLYKPLVRIKNTPQLAHTKSDREAILENAFAFSSLSELPAGHYFLVDDILTTGATLKACAKVLLSEKKISLSMATLAYRV